MQGLENISKSSLVWFLLGGFAFLFVAISHFILQEYLKFPPCEQCVYVRYAFIVLGIGCWLLAWNPKGVFGALGILICAYGIFRGIVAALTLQKIQKALESETVVFGLKGCSLSPKFDFSLPWDVWIPTLFAPRGFCGLDIPMLHGVTDLSALQERLVAFYMDGWYLIPMWKFGTMAECAFAILLVYCAGIALVVWVRLYPLVIKFLKRKF